jgi:GcrA cell cycle regulator
MTAFFRISESIAIAIIRIRLDFGFGISEVNGMASVTVARQRREASTKEKRMQSTNWAGAHSGALREYLAKGMSFSEIAEAINAKFKTAYSRSAAIGRARRMGLAGPDRAKDPPRHWPAAPKAPQPQPPKSRERHVPEFIRPVPMLKRTGTVKLRCVGIDPRHLSLIDLEPDDCRYPYGGEEEGEAITFCGHPRRHGSSYCASHFHLTRGPGTASERSAGTVSLGWWRRHEAPSRSRAWWSP